MPPESRHFSSPFWRVRQYFGISQRELAAYLGISEPMANHLEAGRRTVAADVEARLAPLLGQVREGAADVPQPLGPPAGPLDRQPLEARRAECLHQAGNLRRQLRNLPEQARRAARWARALPTLQASVPLASPAPAGADQATQLEASRQTYVRGWLALQPTTLDADLLSRWHLLLVRAQALEAEAAALSALLA